MQDGPGKDPGKSVTKTLECRDPFVTCPIVSLALARTDGLLTQDDVDDLCHDLDQPGLHHPLSELRSRCVIRAVCTHRLLTSCLVQVLGLLLHKGVACQGSASLQARCTALLVSFCRYLKRIQQKAGDYALLPANDAAGDEVLGGGPGTEHQHAKKKGILHGMFG